MFEAETLTISGGFARTVTILLSFVKEVRPIPLLLEQKKIIPYS